MNEPKAKFRKGFALLDKEKRTKLARKGGKSVPKDGRSFYMDHVLAASAGSKGGLARAENIRKRKELEAENARKASELDEENKA